MDEAQSPTAGGDAETLKVNNDEDKVAGKDVRKTNTTPLKLEITDKETPLKEETTISNTKVLGDIYGIEDQNSSEKSTMYQKGDEFLKTGHNDEALKCFLQSLKGLKESNTFHELPQCLHQISDIYFSKNEYEKAVYFIQAEKMYYETALIDILTFQQQVANKKKQMKSDADKSPADDSREAENEADDESKEDASNSPQVAKANEFENLANLCLKEGKLQLAMEYCGKATKLFREAYGDEHPRTIKALDLFTCIYADVGKKLYEDAMQRFDADKEEKQESSETSSGESSTIRKRRKKKVTFSDDNLVQDSEPEQNIELEPTPLPQEQDDWVVTCLLMVIFLLITVLITLIGSYLYCRNNSQTSFCAELRGDMTYWYMKMRHLYHYYIRGSGN
ncbi:hypothetical protein BSL78_17531 [Apostichopus japonicus]|uniref:Consortin N-terminal domain-containing protein n=1 Tax=Stichopus japonicus TaxID=307972 RepID=A0A2G8KC68_STIJA|nr:hypothetical protein BSL78_17531 [Apostichopus japonicus]